MSDARVEIFKPSGEIIGYSSYQGSADLVHPGIQREIEHWHDGATAGDWDRLCSCEHPGEPGIVYSTYGWEEYWAGLYCPECMVIVGPLSPYPEDYGWSSPPPQGPDPGPEVFRGHPFPPETEGSP